MSVDVERNARKYLNVQNGVALNCDFPCFDAEHVVVRYGRAGALAVPDVDYLVALNEPDAWVNFTVTPTASLITKINDAIGADPDELNQVVVRRIVPHLTDITPETASFRRKISEQFDRLVMMFQQLAEFDKRTLRVSQADVDADVAVLEMPDKTARANGGNGTVLEFDGNGNVVLGPNRTSTVVAAAEAARDAAIAAQGLSEDARDASVIAQGLSEDAQAASEDAQAASEAARDEAQLWAAKTTGAVSGGEFSAKAHASSTDANEPGTGSAKSWAQRVGAAVVAGAYSAKEWAVGTFTRGAAGGGSAKDWATYTAGTVDDAERSAKWYANLAATYAAAINLPAAAGNALRFLRLKADETGFEYRTPAQVLSDIGAFTATDTLTAGEAIDTSTGPKLVYKDEFNQRGGGADRWWLVDSDATAPVRISPTVAFATTSAVAAGNTFTGVVRPSRVTGFTGLTSGAPVWAASTAGAVTQTEPTIPASGAQNAVRLVGYAASATDVEFQPSHDTVFQAHDSALASGAYVTLEHYIDSGARERVARAYIAAPATYTSDIVPAMTGYAAPSGTVTTDDDGNEPAWKLFDNDVSTRWQTLAKTYGWVAYDFGAPKTVKQYTFTANQYFLADRCAKNWTFEGWNGAAWVVLDTQVNQTAWSSGEKRTFPIANATAYNKYRINVSANNGGAYLFMSEFEMMEQNSARDEPLTVGSETVNSAATDRVTVTFSDASGANQDTKTTFYNRTNAARNLIVEVTL